MSWFVHRTQIAETVFPRGKRLRFYGACLSVLLLAVPAFGALLSFISVVRDGVGAVDGLGGVKDIALSNDGLQMYAVGSDDAALAVFNRDPQSGLLSFVEVHEDGNSEGVFGLLGVCGVDASPDRRHVYATAEHDDTLVVFRRDATMDSLTFLPEHVQQDRVGGVFGLDGACGLAVSPDDAQVFVAARADDAVAVFSRDATTDSLALTDVEFEGLAPLRGASDVAISPDNRHLYVSAEFDDAVSVFERHLPTGQIQFVSAVMDGVAGVNGLDGASSLAISPDGRHVYATGRIDNAIVVFERDLISGSLSLLQGHVDGRGSVTSLRGPSDIVVHPSGRWVLATARDSSSLVLFGRNPGSGLLRFLDVLRDGRNGVSGLEGAIAASTSFEHIYAAGFKADAVAIFQLPTQTLPLLADGFESGGWSAWSSAVPGSGRRSVTDTVD